MLRTSPSSVILLALVSLGSGVLVSARKNVTVAYVDEYSWIPHRIAQEQGFFDAVRLNVTLKAYPNRTALLAGANNSEWDFATADMFANILGGQANMTAVGLAMDISNTINMVGNPYAVSNLFPPTPGSFPAICVTKGTLSDYVAQKCMENLGFKGFPAIEVIYENQTHCKNEITPGFFPTPWVDMAGLDSPLHYEFLEANPGSQILCTGNDATAPVTVGHMVRNEFAKEHPNAVTKLLAVWFRTLAYMNIHNNKPGVSQLVVDSYSSFVTLGVRQGGAPDPALDDFSALLPRYGLQDFKSTNYLHFEAQLDLMNRNAGTAGDAAGDAARDVLTGLTAPAPDAAVDPYSATVQALIPYLSNDVQLPADTSLYDYWMDDVARFMADSDMLPANHLSASAFMNDKYMKRLNNMDSLRKWALGGGLAGIETLDLVTFSNATTNNIVVAKGQDLP